MLTADAGGNLVPLEFTAGNQNYHYIVKGSASDRWFSVENRDTLCSWKGSF